MPKMDLNGVPAAGSLPSSEKKAASTPINRVMARGQSLTCQIWPASRT